MAIVGGVVPPESCVVYTPRPLAEAMVDAIGAGDGEWLEPSCGDGVFVKAIRRRFGSQPEVTAVDLATHVEELVQYRAQVVAGVDFLVWSRRCKRRFDFIIGNPPYIRISELPEPLRSSAAEIQHPDGTRRLGLRSNTWYAFLCASLRLLKEGGSLAFVLPAAWDYAEYASPLRADIAQLFRNVAVIRCRRSFFGSVLDGAVVLVAEGFCEQGGEQTRFDCGSMSEVISVLRSRHGGVHCQGSAVSPAMEGRGCTRLGDVVSIIIGAVTGDARYFLLRESDRLRWGLPVDALVPAVTKSRHLRSAEIGRSVWEDLRRSNERVWLFRPSEDFSDRQKVREYLDLKGLGGCNKTAYKVAQRTPWYQTKLPSKGDAFLSGNTRVGPWLAFRRMPGLTASNTLYIVRFNERCDREVQAAWGLAMLTSQSYENWRRSIRAYSDGLVKLEPGDIKKLLVPRPRFQPGALGVYRQAIGLLLAGKRVETCALADRWIGSSEE